MSKVLMLPDVTMNDSGVYHCKAETIPEVHKIVSVRVTVYGECALNSYLLHYDMIIYTFFYNVFHCMFLILLLQNILSSTYPIRMIVPQQ